MLITNNLKGGFYMAEKQKKSIFQRWWFWFIIVVAIIAIASASGNDKPKKVGLTSTQTQEQTQKQSKETTQEFFKIGEIAETKQVKATITQMEKSQGTEFNKPSAGHEFVLLHMTIENVSDQEVNVSSMLNFDAYVDDSAINENLGAQISKEGTNTMDGTIAAGKKLTGVLAYEVPQGWKKLEIHYRPNLSDTTIKWLIENK